MIYTIESKTLKVDIDEVGAQLMSIQTKTDRHEYLWQGDKTYWAGRAYNLFPVIGRMFLNRYTYRGTTYDMTPHGFIRKATLTPVLEGENKITFTYRDNEQTLAVYPFHFNYAVTFEVTDNRLSVTTSVKNTDDKTIHFGVGGHPGFFVPMEEGLNFDDYYITFDKAKTVLECKYTPNVLFTGERPVYPLANNKLPLTHSLFPVDALVLYGTGGKATIQSDKGKRKITMEYPDMPYMGIWHKPGTQAPYVCLEPWSMLPANEGVVDDFETKADMTHLEKGKTYSNRWVLTIE